MTQKILITDLPYCVYFRNRMESTNIFSTEIYWALLGWCYEIRFGFCCNRQELGYCFGTWNVCLNHNAKAMRALSHKRVATIQFRGFLQFCWSGHNLLVTVPALQTFRMVDTVHNYKAPGSVLACLDPCTGTPRSHPFPSSSVGQYLSEEAKCYPWGEITPVIQAGEAF